MVEENKILFLDVPAGPSIWGDGSILKRYPVPVDERLDKNTISGLLAFSGHPYAANKIKNGSYAGQTLHDLYQAEPDLFGNENERRWEIVPIQIGVCHAAEDLSIQVHPREEYAMKYENSHGKSECWYIVDVDEEPASVVLGHNARTMEEFDEYISRDAYDELVQEKPIKKGSFFNLEAGTLHALQKGTTFIEVCTSCLLTYRLFDYHRVDQDGRERDVDIEKVKANVLIPYEEMTYNFIDSDYGDVHERELTDNPNFSVRILDVKGAGNIPKKKPYYACFVVEGEGSINGLAVKSGDSFMLTSQLPEFSLDGDMKILAAHG